MVSLSSDKLQVLCEVQADMRDMHAIAAAADGFANNLQARAFFVVSNCLASVQRYLVQDQ